MNRDDIIRMAIECQLVTPGNRDGIYMEALHHFAALVAAAEREACAQIAEEYRIYGSNCADEIRARGD